MKAITLPAVLTLAFALFSAPLVGAESKTLWLETDDGEILEVPLDESIYILPDGNVEAKATQEFSCSEDTGDCPECPSCDDVEVSLDSGGAYFDVSPNPVTQGNNITVDYYGRGAWACESGGLEGTSWETGNPRLPLATESVDTSPLTADMDHPVELNCFNGPNQAAISLQLRVNAAEDDDDDDIEVPSSCSERTLLGDISGWRHATDVLQHDSSDPTRYFGVFSGEEFQGTKSNKEFYLPKQEFAAMQFTVPEHFSSNEEGEWILTPQTHNLDTFGPGAFMTISISECPGDFDVNNFSDERCIARTECLECRTWTRWTTDPTNDRRCSIEPGETYYMNVVFTASDVGVFPPEQADCNGSPNCGTLIRPD